MAKRKNVSAAKYALFNYECGNCKTGVVQQFREWKRGGTIHTTVSGCLDCGYQYGILQWTELKQLSDKIETTWP